MAIYRVPRAQYPSPSFFTHTLGSEDMKMFLFLHLHLQIEFTSEMVRPSF